MSNDWVASLCTITRNAERDVHSFDHDHTMRLLCLGKPLALTLALLLHGVAAHGSHYHQHDHEHGQHTKEHSQEHHHTVHRHLGDHRRKSCSTKVTLDDRLLMEQAQQTWNDKNQDRARHLREGRRVLTVQIDVYFHV